MDAWDLGKGLEETRNMKYALRLTINWRDHHLSPLLALVDNHRQLYNTSTKDFASVINVIFMVKTLNNETSKKKESCEGEELSLLANNFDLDFPAC